MQKIVSKYFCAAHLALLAVSPLFLFPWFDADTIAGVMLWLCLFAALWQFMEPSRRSGEMLHEARARTGWGVLSDPLTWCMLAIVVMAALRWANSNVQLEYDGEEGKWLLREPVLSFFPSAAEGHGKLEFASTLSIMFVLAGIRHSLGRFARISFLFTSSLLAGIAGAIAVVTVKFHGGITLTTAKATFANPSFVGGVFAAYALAALVAAAGSVQARWKHTGLFSTLAMGGAFAAAFIFAPAAPVLLYAIAAVLTFLFCLIYLGVVSGAADALKFFALAFIGVAIGVFGVITLAPEDVVNSRFEEIATLSLFPRNFMEVRAILSRVAASAWESARWLGTGLGTFAWQTRFNAQPEDWRIIGMARPAAFSGWWTLIAERGIIGAFAIAAPLGFLLFTHLRRIPRAFAGGVFWPACWLGFALAGVAAAESFMDATFLRPEAMMAICAFLALGGLALPAPVQTEDPDDDD